MKMDDNNLHTQSKSLLDPLEILSAKVKGYGFQSVAVPCPDGTLGIRYFVLFSGDREVMTFTLDGVEVMQAITNSDIQAEWRQKVLAEANACISQNESKV